MPPLLNTVIIDHPDNPQNVITLPKQRQPKRRLLVYVERIGFEKFDDSSDAPFARIFPVEDVPSEDWYFLRDKGYTWVLETGPELALPIDINHWINEWFAHRKEITNRLLQRLGLDPEKYRVSGYEKDSFEPIPTLHEIKR